MMGWSSRLLADQAAIAVRPLVWCKQCRERLWDHTGPELLCSECRDKHLDHAADAHREQEHETA